MTIKDLFVFDRTGNKVTAYINGGTPNTVDYTHAPQYEKKFPALMRKNDFNITLDVCHLGQSGGDIIRFLKDNIDRIVNIHLSDYKSHYLNSSLRPMRYKHMRLGKGELPLSEFIKTLKDKNYQGIITLELETDLDGLLESAEMIRNTV